MDTKFHITIKPKISKLKMRKESDRKDSETLPQNIGVIFKSKNELSEQTLSEKCWVGWTQKGLKKKGNKLVPNCVKVSENFLDGKNPEDKGDMGRYGLKGKSINQLKKIRSSSEASPRKKQLAHWFINMHSNKND